MSIRSTFESTEEIANSTDIIPVIVITKPGDTGVFVVTISSYYTALFDFTRAVYDIELYDDSDPPVVIRLFQGFVTLAREVTR
jgi:hypothetical protein